MKPSLSEEGGAERRVMGRECEDCRGATPVKGAEWHLWRRKEVCALRTFLYSAVGVPSSASYGGTFLQ